VRGSATLRKFLFGSAFAALIWFSIFGFPRAQLTLTSVMPNASSVTAGSPVIWTAAAAGGLGPYRYKFFVWDGTAWTVGQEWSTTNTWTWIPPAAGTYSFQVWARNARSRAAFDAWRSFGPMTVGVPAGLTVTVPTPNLTAPVPAGTPVTWTAKASGGPTPYTYKFYVWDGTAWAVGQEWSTTDTWTWIPPTAGTYSFRVWARNAGSSAEFDAWRSFGPMTVGVPAALTVTVLTPNLPSPVPAGMPVTWTAKASGGTTPYTYKFLVWDGSSWTLGQDWSPVNIWTWSPPTAGTYSFQVWARNARSSAEFDAWRSFGPMTAGSRQR
jgi:N-acetylmuramoyl-L-alanine amidase